MESVRVAVFDIEDFAKLQQINKALHGDGTHLTPDQRRDLANLMTTVMGSAIEMNLDEVKA